MIQHHLSRSNSLPHVGTQLAQQSLEARKCTCGTGYELSPENCSLAVHCELKPNRPATKYADLRITVPICYTLCRFCRINKDAGSSNGTSNVNSTYVRADSLMAAMKAEIREHNETLRRGSEVYEITDETRVHIQTRADIMGVLWADGHPGCASAAEQLIHPNFSGKCKHCCECHGGPCVSVILDGLSWTHALGQMPGSGPAFAPTAAASSRQGAATPPLAAYSHNASPASKNQVSFSSAYPWETDPMSLYRAAITPPSTQVGPLPFPIARQQTDTEVDAVRQKAVSEALRERFAKEHNFVPVAKVRGNVWAASWDYNLQRLRLTETYKKGAEVAGYTTKKDDWYKALGWAHIASVTRYRPMVTLLKQVLALADTQPFTDEERKILDILNAADATGRFHDMFNVGKGLREERRPGGGEVSWEAGVTWLKEMVSKYYGAAAS